MTIKKIAKSYLKTSIFLLSFLFLTSFTFSNAESIKSLNSDVKINKDGTISIIETIDYDFGNNQKHGIFRDIPFIKVNEDGKRYKLKIAIEKVTDSNGSFYNYSTSYVGDNLELKIGDANKLVTGVKTYVLKYNVSGAITYFTDHDELYWNLSGNDWDVPINSYTANIFLPDGINENDIKYVCYEGPRGSNSQSCSISYSGGLITVSSSRLLSPGEGLTAAVAFPKNIVAFLEPQVEKTSMFLIFFWLLLGILGLLWYLIYPIKIIIEYIRENALIKNNLKIVSAWFEPPQYTDGTVFSPAETGFIVDNKIDHRELTGTIIDLAQRGYLKIKEGKDKHFSFVRQKSTNSPELRNFESQVMKAIFKESSFIAGLDEDTASLLDTSLSKLEDINDEIKIPHMLDINKHLENSISDQTQEVKDSDLKKSKSLFSRVVKFNNYVESEIVDRGMYEKKPSEISTRYSSLAFMGFLSGNLFLLISALLFGKKSVKRTLIGIEKYSEAKSLLNFLKSQDEQLNFQAKNQMFFEKLLPYAAAFGVEKIWAKRFADLDMVKPDWYEGSSFTNAVFISSLTRNIGGTIVSATSSSMSSNRSSSGFSSGFSGGGFSGGSSGGGGGGGGGGSW